MSLSVRRATGDDAAGIARVYNAGIAERVATFETEPRTADDVRARMRDARPEHVTLVAVDSDDEVLGAAWLTAYSQRPAYAGVAEFSVYVGEAARGHGVGTVLMAGLLQNAQGAGLHKLTSRVFVENRASRSLLGSLGFVEVGVHRRHARLDGQWRDCVVVERLLGDG